MSFERFDDDCPNCRPCLIDIETGHKLPDDAPEMQAVMRVWRQTSRQERMIFHRVTCLNSRAPRDLRIMQSLAHRIQETMQQTVH